MDICDSNSFSEKMNLLRLQVLHEDNPSVPIRGKTLQNLRPRWSTPSMRLFKLDGGWRRTGQSTYTSCFSFFYLNISFNLNIFTCVTQSFYYYVTLTFYLNLTLSFYINQYLCYSSFLLK